MLVYGDHAWEEAPRDKLARIELGLRGVAAMPAGIERHGGIVALLIEAGELAQGLADAAFAARGADARSPAADAAMKLAIGLARCVRRSLASGFAALGHIPAGELRALAALALPETVRINLPEGYAFYALYPEGYIRAAEAPPRRPPGSPPRSPPRIIGLRSIGTSLAAAVAAGAGSGDVATLRPAGHPFRRRLALSDALRDEILSGPATTYAIVDEGPGLSGSSFGCVADLLEDHGVAPARIHFFPSHPGDLGPEASPRHRARWAKARRHLVGFDALFLHLAEPAHRLESWFADLVGRPTEPLADLSGGAWRNLRDGSQADWPPVNTQQERRKFLLRGDSGPWLVKFAGLGRYGAEKLDPARTLAEAGFTPPAAGFRHGFLIERWLEDAMPLRSDRFDRRRLVDELGRYLGFRARHLPAGRPGASPKSLWGMAARNTALALGAESARALAAWKPILPRLARWAVPIRTDNRLHAWEWLVHDGRLIKTDAVDHHAAHDLVGCQDLAWDIAGATVEFGLADDERDRLCALAEREAGRPLAPELVAFCTTCYVAFQLGAWTLAAQVLAADAAEAERLRAAAARYTQLLRCRLGETAAAPAIGPLTGEASCA